MRLGFRLLLGYFLIVGLAAFFVLNVFVDEVKPGVRQAMEDDLVDTAHLLAEMAVDDLRAGRIRDGDFARRWEAYRGRSFKASIWGFRKNGPGLRVYITDTRGIVVFDSEKGALGQDYSRWNDVYSTLRGDYGVRTSPEVNKGVASTTMYVAAPVQAEGRLLGVLTVAKSNLSVQPFIERSQNKIVRAGLWLLAVSLLIGMAAALWLSWSVRRLVNYADAVSRGERVSLPELSGSEMRRLGLALESMRARLEGKNYVEQYVTTLTHEMKSPLAAIQGSAELLDEDMPEAQRQRFLTSIREQTVRLRQFIDKMLAQATVEQRQSLQSPQAVDLARLCEEAVRDATPQAAVKQQRLVLDVEALPSYSGDAFLLKQALANLIDNAIAFSPAGADIAVGLHAVAGAVELSVLDHGSGIPDYALPRVCERFYSLPRPDGGPKSTGLGLSFVQEVMQLHGGELRLEQPEGGGVRAVLRLP